jgi:hypothetical protein
MMLIMVEFERFRGRIGRERIVSIGKRIKRERHAELQFQGLNIAGRSRFLFGGPARGRLEPDASKSNCLTMRCQYFIPVTVGGAFRATNMQKI